MTAPRHNITVEQGADFSLVLQWRNERGEPVDVSGLSGTDLLMQIREQVADDEGSPLPAPVVELSLSNGRIVLLPQVVAPAAIDVDFQADNVIRFDATLDAAPDLSETGEPVREFDEVVVSGSTSNDGTYQLVAATPGEVRVENPDGSPVTFTAEPAAGTFEIRNPGRFELLMSAAVTQAIQLTDDRGVYDLEATVGGDTTRLLQGVVLLSREVTRL